MGHQGAFIAQTLCISALDEQGRQAFEVAKQRRRIWVSHVIADEFWSKEAFDRVQMIVVLRLWQIVIALAEKAFSDRLLLAKEGSSDIQR